MKFSNVRFLKVLLCVTVLLPGIASGQKLTLADLPTGTTAPEAATVVTTIKSDIANHSCCVLALLGLIEVLMQDGALVIRETDNAKTIPWLDFGPMAVDNNLAFSGQSRATVAGFNNILTTINGSIGLGVISGEIVIGANGGLPQGAPLEYEFQFNSVKTEYFLTNFISFHTEVGFVFGLVNPGEFGRVKIDGPDDALELFLSIDINDQEGDADWWIVMLSEGGDLFSFDLATGQFEPGFTPTVQGPLTNIPAPISIIKDLIPPSNNTTIVFGVDRNPNGEFDIGSFYGTGFTVWFN